jgi:hypothetical protein
MNQTTEIYRRLKQAAEKLPKITQKLKAATMQTPPAMPQQPSVMNPLMKPKTPSIFTTQNNKLNAIPKLPTIAEIAKRELPTPQITK